MGAIAFKVLDEGRGVFANGAKVDWPTASCEEEEAVEFLKQDGRRLVDGAEDSLSVVCKLTHKTTDRPGSLRVETGGRLVEEEE